MFMFCLHKKLSLSCQLFYNVCTAQIFVQLTPLIDVVGAISEKSSSNLAAIIDRQAPVFESPAKTKVTQIQNQSNQFT